MMFLASAQQPGLIVKPTYRLIGNLKENQINELLGKVESEFDCENQKVDEGIKSIEKQAYHDSLPLSVDSSPGGRFRRRCESRADEGQHALRDG